MIAYLCLKHTPIHWRCSCKTVFKKIYFYVIFLKLNKEKCIITFLYPVSAILTCVDQYWPILSNIGQSWSVLPYSNYFWPNLIQFDSVGQIWINMIALKVSVTRRYNLLHWPTSISCSELQPLAKVCFAVWIFFL